MTHELGDRTRLHRKANQALDDNLVPGESVEVVITGPSNQAVIGTQRRVFVYKKGFMAGASFGSELTSWDYRNLVGVQLHTGMMSGAVVLQAPGQSGVSTSYWKNSDSDPYKAPNAIPIVRPYDQAQAGVARLRELIDAAHQTHSRPTGGDLRPLPMSPVPERGDAPRWEDAGTGQAGPSGVQLLKDLAELRDAGILSDEEFNAKKFEILKRL